MVKAKQLTLPIAYDRDGSVSEQFFLNVTPQHVLIDKAGIVRFVGHAVTPELERTIATVIEEGARAVAAAPAPAPAQSTPALVLDNGSKLDLATRPKAPLALTFVTLFCDSYIADTARRPARRVPRARSRSRSSARHTRTWRGSSSRIRCGRLAMTSTTSASGSESSCRSASIAATHGSTTSGSATPHDGATRRHRRGAGPRRRRRRQARRADRQGALSSRESQAASTRSQYASSVFFHAGRSVQRAR